MTADDVAVILDLFEQAGIRTWVGGGWGVDALVGRQTRHHADLDLMVRRELEGEVIEMLAGAGFTETLDRRPGRFVMSDGRRELDLHPVEVRADGSAVLRTHDGRRFDYQASDFTTGTVGNRTVPCVTASLQWTFHQGYEPSPEDLHDLALLGELLGY
jgi:lincosamide nucleotidyltransferase A/C/D/E